MTLLQSLTASALLGSLLSATHATTANTPNIRILNAAYTIPVPANSSAELRAVATFPIVNYTLDLTDEANGVATMSYTLPDLLLGREQFIQMNLIAKVDNRREFAGPLATASCEGPWAAMTCHATFMVKPDLVKLEAMLLERQDPAKDLRLEIARRFGNDPIGVTQVGP